MRSVRVSALAFAASALAACTPSIDPATAPAGSDTTIRTDVLKAGAAMIQGEGPLEGFNVYLVGFHPMKEMPSHQMEAHHFCKQVNEDFAQCVLFDANSSSSNMTGVEYIISEKLHEGLPAEERTLWHPHNGEILSGQLVAPGLPEIAEKELMKGKMNSYGKTWHTWATDQGRTIPMGEPMLAWSFNREGEDAPGLIAKRDEVMKTNTARIRASRQDLIPFAKPQEGVDALKDKFGRPSKDIPGVTNKLYPKP